jgi:hypothetical protein
VTSRELRVGNITVGLTQATNLQVNVLIGTRLGHGIEYIPAVAYKTHELSFSLVFTYSVGLFRG